MDTLKELGRVNEDGELVEELSTAWIPMERTVGNRIGREEVRLWNGVRTTSEL